MRVTTFTLDPEDRDLFRQQITDDIHRLENDPPPEPPRAERTVFEGALFGRYDHTLDDAIAFLERRKAQLLDGETGYIEGYDVINADCSIQAYRDMTPEEADEWRRDEAEGRRLRLIELRQDLSELPET